MESSEAIKIVMQVISEALEEKIELAEDMKLIGGESLLDSMQLVEVCLALEDSADDFGFEFDWTSDTAMSRSRSMFRTIGSLSEEFSNQSNGAE